MFVLKCFKNFSMKKTELIVLLSGKMPELTEHACVFNATFILNDRDMTLLSYLVILKFKEPVRRR